MDSLNATEYIRRELYEIKGEFSAETFRDIQNASAVMFKFMQRGEIAFVRWEAKTSSFKTGGRPNKIYRVVQLRPLKVKQEAVRAPKVVTCERCVAPLHSVIQNWRDVFPDMFAIPNFKILGSKIHKLGA